MNGILPQPKRPHRRLWTAAVLGVLLAGVPAADALTTRGEIYPGVTVGAITVGGMSEAQARETLAARFAEFEETPLTFVQGAVQTTVPAGELIQFDAPETVKRAAAVGRGGDPLRAVKEKVRARLRGAKVEPVIQADPERMRIAVEQELGAVAERKPQDAQLIFAFNDGRASVTVHPEREGSELNLDAIVAATMAEVRDLKGAPIVIASRPVPPAVAAADLEPLLPEARTLLNRAPLTVKALGKSWTLTPQTIAGWLIISKGSSGSRLEISRELMGVYLDGIAKEVERAPQDATFELTADEKKVKKFQVGKSGLQLPRPENLELIDRALRDKTVEVELLTREAAPEVSTSHGAELYGIKELVSRATTNFKGSPPNRIKNIKRGAAILNGTLIKAQEEFSLLDALRPFTRENGYLAELVIKAAEGRTVPEIGGGLCQIGTTMFRTALNAGLPITARRNHSYRVSYYEPPVGMDATIYDPAPDFKFINDTGGWLLLLTHMEGNELTFELWGAKDGRTVAISEPEISNLRRPPEKKIIETADLPVGKIKCTEKPHVGSDARFTYAVTYADGRIEEQEFKSRYRPWQEVCLVGVAPVPQGAEAPTPPETPATAPETLPSADTLGVLGDIVQ